MVAILALVQRFLVSHVVLTLFAKPWSHFYNVWWFPSLGDPAGARGKPGSGYGYGVGIRVDSPLGPLRLEYAFNDKQARRFHFGVGHRN